MIARIWMIAARDFKATLTARGFIIGLLLVPVVLLLGFTVVPRLMSAAAGPQVKGDIAVIDRSGQVLPELTAALEPQAIAARRDKALAQQLQAGTPAPAFGWVAPQLTVHELPGGADPATEKRWLLEPQAQGARHLALVVIPVDAVTPGAARRYGSYQLYVSRGVTFDTEMALRGAVREALVSTRVKQKGLDRADIERTLDVTQLATVVVAPQGEQSSQPLLQRLLPFICGALLLMVIVTGGTALMTSMVEEKSGRVVEVLLAAVSPLELMWGKLLAQFAIGLLMLTAYVGFGLLALGQAAATGGIAPMLVLDLVVLFLLAYLTYGALMLTIGAAVSSNADAQSLLTPVMMLLMIPYVLTVFVGQAPNAPFIVILSFVPPVNSFLMLARLASDAPPPFWQVPLTVALGLVFDVLVLWFAAKVFKIALLMHGKPPNLATLVRWARMA